MKVAALYVDPKGVYAGLEGVEVWDEARDARLYAGPWPVVAHPPCAKWSPLAYINRQRIAGYEFGGVLEHPALSLAWKHFDLPRPERWDWKKTLTDDGLVTEVDQGRYGHRAQKRTWLYVVGLDPPELDWRPAPSPVVVSGFLHRTGTDETRRVRPHEAAATPPAFRDVLLAMARSAAKVPA